MKHTYCKLCELLKGAGYKLWVFSYNGGAGASWSVVPYIVRGIHPRAKYSQRYSPPGKRAKVGTLLTIFPPNHYPTPRIALFVR